MYPHTICEFFFFFRYTSTKRVAGGGSKNRHYHSQLPLALRGRLLCLLVPRRALHRAQQPGAPTLNATGQPQPPRYRCGESSFGRAACGLRQDDSGLNSAPKRRIEVRSRIHRDHASFQPILKRMGLDRCQPPHARCGCWHVSGPIHVSYGPKYQCAIPMDTSSRLLVEGADVPGLALSPGEPAASAGLHPGLTRYCQYQLSLE